MVTEETPAIVETTETVETTQVETTTEAQVKTTETAPEQAAVTEWFKNYEWESEDVAKQEIETLRSYRGKDQELTTREQEIQGKLELAKEMENPVPEALREIVAFAKQTGVTDVAAIKGAMSVTVENAKTDPISVIALQMQIQNPEKYEGLGGKAGVEEAIREKYNLPYDGEYTPSKLLVSEAIDAYKEIEKITKNVKVDENPFTFAQAQKQEGIKQAEERRVQSVGELEKFTTKLEKVEYKYGEKSLPLSVSKDEVTRVMETFKPVAHMTTATSKEDVERLRGWATDQILLSKLKSGEIGLEIEKSLRAESKKEAVKEVHNGQPKTVDRTGKTTTVEGKISPIRAAAIRDGLIQDTNN